MSASTLPIKPEPWTTHTDADAPPRSHVFVFGSNLAGRHGAGAALAALKYFGAKPAVGMGPMGRAYAIPTKGQRLQVLPIAEIATYATRFVAYAREHHEERFYLTRIGCGLAGYQNAEMAPLFCGVPFNVDVPESWLSFLIQGAR
jgi:hypothetical protein